MTYPGTGAYASTITLQMPFIAGESIAVSSNLVDNCSGPTDTISYTGVNR